MDTDLDDPEEVKRTAAEWRRQLREDAQAMMDHIRGMPKPTDYLEACRAVRYFTLADQMICQTCKPLPDPAAEPRPEPAPKSPSAPKTPSHTRPRPSRDIDLDDDEDEDDGWMLETDDGSQDESRYYPLILEDHRARMARDEELRRGGHPAPFVTKHFNNKGYRAFLARVGNKKIEAFRDAMLRRGHTAPENAWFKHIYHDIGLAVANSGDPPEASHIFATADPTAALDDFIFGPRGTDQHGNPVYAQKPPP